MSGGATRAGNEPRRWPLVAVALPILALLVLPLVALLLASSPTDLRTGVEDPLFAPALWLSTRTTLVSLVLVIVFGTPLAWWLATAPQGRSRTVEVFVELNRRSKHS